MILVCKVLRVHGSGGILFLNFPAQMATQEAEWSLLIMLLSPTTTPLSSPESKQQDLSFLSIQETLISALTKFPWLPQVPLSSWLQTLLSI